MNSVLEALKRMEEDETRGEVVSFSDKGLVNAGSAGRWLLLLVVFAAGVGGAAAGFYLAYRPERPVVPEEEMPKTVSVFRVVAPPASPVAKPAGTKALEKIVPPVVATPTAIKKSATQKVRRTGPSATNATEPRVSSSAEPEVAQSLEASENPPEEARKLPPADASTYDFQGV